jgi:hypothetical protein
MDKKNNACIMAIGFGGIHFGFYFWAHLALDFAKTFSRCDMASISYEILDENV